MTIRENAIRESVADKTVCIHHIAGLHNIADIFTKELGDNTTFLAIRDTITSIVPQIDHKPLDQRKGGIPTYVGSLHL